MTKRNEQKRDFRRVIRSSAHHQLLVAVVVLNLRVLALLLLGLAVTVAVDAQTYGIQRPNYIRSLRATHGFLGVEVAKKKKTKRTYARLRLIFAAATFIEKCPETESRRDGGRLSRGCVVTNLYERTTLTRLTP